MFTRPEAATLSVRMHLATSSRAVNLEARLGDRTETAVAYLRVNPADVTQTTSAISRMSRGYGAVRAGDSLDPAQDLGAQLFELLFDGPLSELWNNVASAEREGTTTRIVLEPTDELLSAMPWELMYDRRRGSFVALSPRTPVTRRHVTTASPSGTRVSSPPTVSLRVINANADGYGDTAAEERTFAALRETLGGRLLMLPTVDAVDFGTLATTLTETPCDVVHFNGTGNFDCDDASHELLRLAGGRTVPFRKFAEVIQAHPPTVLFLSTENSAWFARELAPFVPFVAGMQGRVSVESTTKFERAFYRDVLSGRSAGAAITSARQALHADRASVRDWALVIAYSQVDDLRLASSPDRSESSSDAVEYGVPPDSEQPPDKESARQWTRLQRRMEILGTNLSALKARPIKSQDVEDQIRDTLRQIERLTSELRSLGTRKGG